MNDFLLWQLADSALPTGGFAHSGGLEAAWQHGEVRDGEALRVYAETALTQAGHGALPFVRAAANDPGQLADIDRLCDAFLSNHVANRASRAQGQALLAVAKRSLSQEDQPAVHFAPVFGAVTRRLGMPAAQAVRLFLFIQLRGLISSAVRLGIIGPLEGQAIQHRLADHAETVAQRCGEISVDDIAQTAPLPDLWQGTQDRLYSRLFQT